MKVTFVDSKPAVVGMVDCLDYLPTQPPSLYLDIEGVRLSRHGSISLIQLLVSPQQHIYLIDVFVLKEAAFSTANDLGTTFRSILESAHVPKVFFDVRRDSDALFAHFQVSLQCVCDLQLLELAACPYLRERVSGLAACIERDAQLPCKDVAAWKATKQKGLFHFSPEHGGSYEVFNARPMLQDIVDYCTQDVVYLPVLWKVYNRKIFPKWMKKVMRESRERIVASQKATHELTGKERILSPWAKSAKSAKVKQQGSNDAGSPERKTVIASAQVAAIEAARKPPVTQPEKTTDSGPSAGPEAGLRRSARLAARQAPKATVGLEGATVGLQGPLSRLDISETKPIVHSARTPSSWTCVICSREMQQDQKENHIAGKQHIARVKQIPALQTSTPKGKPLQPTKGSKKSPQSGASAAKAVPRKTKREKTRDLGMNSKNRQAAVPQSQVIGQPYPTDHLILGFQGGAAPENHQYETLYDSYDVDYETLWPCDDVDYNACDKDCGWCGHCMDGVDI